MTGRDRGISLAVEAVLVIPALVLVLGLMVAGWRLWSVRTEVRFAAQSSARAASLQVSGTSAKEAALRVAHEQLAGVPCVDRRVDVDTTEFARVDGADATVRVHVRCRVTFDDLLLPGMPGSVDASASGASVLDRFRERRP